MLLWFMFLAKIARDRLSAGDLALEAALPSQQIRHYFNGLNRSIFGARTKVKLPVFMCLRAPCTLFGARAKVKSCVFMAVHALL